MCTVTLEYNQHNALARRKLAALLATGLFLQKEIVQNTSAQEEAESYKAKRDAFLAHSKKSMSKVIARYLN